MTIEELLPGRVKGVVRVYSAVVREFTPVIPIETFEIVSEVVSKFSKTIFKVIGVVAQSSYVMEEALVSIVPSTSVRLDTPVSYALE